MALPNIGELTADISTGVFKQRLEDLRDVIAAQEITISNQATTISNQATTILSLGDRITALESLISKSGDVITLHGNVEPTGYIEVD